MDYKYDVFLSYSHEDKLIVHELYNRLKNDGLRVWIDERAIEVGGFLPQEIKDGLEGSRISILTLSHSSLRSNWAEAERRIVVDRDPDNAQRRFVPVRLDDCAIPNNLKYTTCIDYKSKDDEVYQKLLAFCESNPLGEWYGVDSNQSWDGLLLSVNVRNPQSRNAILYYRDHPLTDEIVAMMKKHGVDKIKAHHGFRKKISESAQRVEEMLNVIDDITAPGSQHSPQEKKDMFRSAKNLIEEKIIESLDLFHPRAVTAFKELSANHKESAIHSIITGLNVINLGKELNWKKKKIVRGALAAILHDVGKKSIHEDALKNQDKLDGKHQELVKRHSVKGFNILLEIDQEDLNDDAMAALTHHEWYADSNRGYGGLTTFRDEVSGHSGIRDHDGDIIKINVDYYLKHANQDQLDTLQAIVLADAVSVLEEAHSDKGELRLLQVMIIMINHARKGRFNPDHFRAWYRLNDKTDMDLLLGCEMHRFSFPREMEEDNLELSTKEVPLQDPLPIMTLDELKQMGVYKRVEDLGLDLERFDRRGGIHKRIIDSVVFKKNLKPIITDELLKENKINLEKNSLTRKAYNIKLDVAVDCFKYDDLESPFLRSKLEPFNPDYKVIQMDGGILLYFIANRIINESGKSYDNAEARKIDLIREIEVLKKESRHVTTGTRKKFTIELPVYGNRLGYADLKKLGLLDNLSNVNEKVRVKIDNLEKYEKRALSLNYLIKNGFNVKSDELRKNGINPEKKIFYDIKIYKALPGSLTAKVSIFREDEEENIKFVFKCQGSNILVPVAEHKTEKDEVIEIIDLDFSEALKPPDLSNIILGSHWSPN
ncbi:MAG: TIR domain-containing protein [Magnetococcales bacterium]|nr:TIR domain-containing protein [Magnetococcales bacterium]